MIFEGFFFCIGILAIIHVIDLVVRLIIGYLHPKVDLKKEFSTKWILITGANNGVGRLISIEYAKQGYNIIGTGRDLARLESVKKECEEHGVEFVPVQADFEKNGSVEAVMEALGDRDIGVFFLNAGFAIFGDFLSYKEEKLATYCNAMVVNQALLIRALLLRNKDRKEKSLIYITASLAAQAIWPNGQIYCAVKAFISSFAKHIALEAENYSNVKVQALHPGFFRNSGFFDQLPHFVRVLFGTSSIFQTSEDVCNVMLKSPGASQMVDTSISGVIIRVSYWFAGEYLITLIGRLLIWVTKTSTK
jgi:short-subunit dehydrogenase